MRKSMIEENVVLPLPCLCCYSVLHVIIVKKILHSGVVAIAEQTVDTQIPIILNTFPSLTPLMLIIKL